MKLNDSTVNHIPLTKKNIVDTIYEALPYCYGITGLAVFKNKKGKEEDGLYVHVHHDGTYEVKIYVMTVPEVKISETLRSCQKTIRFFLEHKFPKVCRFIDVYGEEISSLN